MKTKLLMALFVLMGIVINVLSQTTQVVASSGGNYQGSGISIEWTLGEQVISTLSTSNTILTQGFHQPSIQVIINDISDQLSFSIDAYPNPTYDFLMIKLGSHEFQDLQFVLYDINGKLLDRMQPEDELSTIDMINYKSGIYLLKVMQANEEIVTYKIIKN